MYTYDVENQKWEPEVPKSEWEWDDTDFWFDKNPYQKLRKGTIVAASTVGFPMYGSECRMTRTVTIKEDGVELKYTRRYFGDDVSDYTVGTKVLFSEDRNWLEIGWS